MKTIILKQLEALLEDVHDPISNYTNASAFLNSVLDDINWVGFYLLKDGRLDLGPFQGKVACVTIEPGKGVCGTALVEKRTLRVANVHDLPNHIACDQASMSEIVVPLFKREEVIGVLDIDSPVTARFSEKDQLFIEACARIIERYV